ncbi:MAG: hypothetical protein K1X81_06185 [Bacteroidia bacterium]|nr:hypothetical protein [Bacteroidia bacterium]
MKKGYLLFVLFSLANTSFCQIESGYNEISRIYPISTFKLNNNLFLDKRSLTFSDWVSFISSPFLTELNLKAPDYDIPKLKFYLTEGSKHPNKIIQNLPVDELMLFTKWRSAVVNHFKKQFTTGSEGCKGNKYYEQFRKIDPNNEWQICYELAPDSILKNYHCKGIRCIAFYKKNILTTTNIK